MNRAEHARLKAEVDLIVNAVWNDEARPLEEGEAQAWLNLVLEHERRAQENLCRLAEAHFQHLIDKPATFSEMRLTPTQAWDPYQSWA